MENGDADSLMLIYMPSVHRDCFQRLLVKNCLEMNVVYTTSGWYC